MMLHHSPDYFISLFQSMFCPTIIYKPDRFGRISGKYYFPCDQETDETLLEAAKGCPVMAIFLTDETGKQVFP